MDNRVKVEREKQDHPTDTNQKKVESRAEKEVHRLSNLSTKTITQPSFDLAEGIRNSSASSKTQTEDIQSRKSSHRQTHSRSSNSRQSLYQHPKIGSSSLHQHHFKKPRTSSPPLSQDDSESEVESLTARSSRCNSLSVTPSPSESYDSPLSQLGSAQESLESYASNKSTPLRYSFGVLEGGITTKSHKTGFETMSSTNNQGYPSDQGSHGVDGLLTDKMLTLSDSSDPVGQSHLQNGEPPNFTSLPSYSEAMEQSIEVHSPSIEKSYEMAAVPSAQEQLDRIAELKNQPLESGASWYVVDRVWLNDWSTFCKHSISQTAADPPKAISNENLIYSTTPLALKSGLEEGIDFEVLPVAAWNLLVAWYGQNGNAIERKVIKLPSSGTLRLELYPPLLHVYYVPKNGAVDPFCFSLSTLQTMADLRNKVEKYVEEHYKLAFPSADVTKTPETRLWRLPFSEEDEALRALNAKDIQDMDGKEEIKCLETTTLAEAQIDQPVEILAIEVISPDNIWPLGPDGTGQSHLKGLFSQDGGAFLTNQFRMAKGTSMIATSESSVAPAGRVTRSQTAAERGTDKNAGLTGLYNLGNTCFMNSALQCMSNTKELKDYFVTGVYKSEVNTSNPLGMGGAMAKVFGELLVKLWRNGGGAVHPREFKTVLSRFASQFTGYAQQDTQELLAFLLDGLHEDLNRIVKKPYIESPDWEGGGLKEMITFAHKQWEIYKMRNDSVIVDLFQGQYRSTLVCPTCKKVSIKFDPFMYLTLPIPSRKTIIRKIIFVNEIQEPVEVEMKLTGDMTFGMLKRKLATLFHTQDERNLIACDVFSKNFYRIYDDSDPVTEIGQNDVTYVYELSGPVKPIAPLSRSRYSYSHSYEDIKTLEETQSPPDVSEKMVILPLFSLSETNEGTQLHSSYSIRSSNSAFGQPMFICIPESKIGNIDAIEEAVLNTYVAVSCDAPQLAQYMDALKEEKENGGKESNYVKEMSEDWDLMEDSKVEVEGEEGVIIEDTVAEISDAGQTVRIVPDHRNKEKRRRIPSPSKAKSPNKLHSLHFLVHREDQAPITKSPEKYERVGEELEERAERLKTSEGKQWPLLYTGGALVCVWKEKAVEQFFDENQKAWSIPTEKMVDPELQADREQSVKKTKTLITIDDCLDEFTKAEQLGESDPWYCPHCKEFKQATKKFDLWKVPDILVVHLKRFSGGRITRDKIDNLIDFPIDGLDLTDRVEGAKSVQKLHEEEGDEGDRLMESISSLDANDDAVESDAPIYDLYAVDNHYGGLGGGHYTAYAKNPENGQWHYFDDSSVRSVSDPQEVKSTAAYLLFYRRRTTRPIGGKSREKVQQTVQANQMKGEQSDGEDHQGDDGTWNDGENIDTEMNDHSAKHSPNSTTSGSGWSPNPQGQNLSRTLSLSNPTDDASDHGSMQVSSDEEGKGKRRGDDDENHMGNNYN